MGVGLNALGSHKLIGVALLGGVALLHYWEAWLYCDKRGLVGESVLLWVSFEVSYMLKPRPV